MERWHVVLGTFGVEMLTAQRLSKHEGVTGFCPGRRRTLVKFGRKLDQVVAAAPRYLFARWQTESAELWHVVMGTPGVVRLLGGGSPTPLLGRDLELLQRWMARAEPDGNVPGLELRAPTLQARTDDYPGDTARLVTPTGLYDGITGEVLWISDKRACLQGPRGVVVAPVELCERVDPLTLSPPSRAAKTKFRNSRNYLKKLTLDRADARVGAS